MTAAPRPEIPRRTGFNPIAKARARPTSLRFAINGKCWWCVGEGFDPNPRKAIRECGIRACTLWPVRPFQKTRGEGKA